MCVLLRFVRCVEVEGVVVLEIIVETLLLRHVSPVKKQRPRKMKEFFPIHVANERASGLFSGFPKS